MFFQVVSSSLSYCRVWLALLALLAPCVVKRSWLLGLSLVSNMCVACRTFSDVIPNSRSKFVPVSVDPFSGGVWCAVKQTGSIKSCIDGTQWCRLI